MRRIRLVWLSVCLSVCLSCDFISRSPEKTSQFVAGSDPSYLIPVVANLTFQNGTPKQVGKDQYWSYPVAVYFVFIVLEDTTGIDLVCKVFAKNVLQTVLIDLTHATGNNLMLKILENMSKILLPYVQRHKHMYMRQCPRILPERQF